MANTVIPLVDLEDLASSPKDPSCQPVEKLQAISLECADSLRTYGIMYIKNHGIPQELVSNKNHTQYAFACYPLFDYKSVSHKRIEIAKNNE